MAGKSPNDPVLVFINPELLWISDEAQTGDEGCLSFPGIFVPVKRGMRARVRALDLEGKPFEIEGEELFARALQHESDHLIGRLLIDLVGPVKREIIKRKMKKEALGRGRVVRLIGNCCDRQSAWPRSSFRRSASRAATGPAPPSAAPPAASRSTSRSRPRSIGAETSDRLADTIDFRDIAEAVVSIGVGEPHHLLESLARRMVTALAAKAPGARIRLELRKLSPPYCAGNPAHAAVRITSS